MTRSLEAFVRDRLAETAKSNPGLHRSLQEVGGLLLLGSMGIEVALKPDGSVWVREDEIGAAVQQPWRVASDQERLGFLNDASDKCQSSGPTYRHDHQEHRPATGATAP